MSKQEQLSPSRLQEIASPKIIITATFTSEPIEDSLSYWLQEMGISYGIEFAPYNQVFQELLSPTSLFVSNQNGINIVLVRLEDWKGNNMGQNSAKIEKTVQDFANALKTAILRSQSPCLVCICPPTPNNDTAFQILHERMQEQLAVEIEGVNGLYLITSQELTNLYPVEDYYDSYGDELGHIPYTPTLFSALGTMLARKIFALNSNPYKVIVLDCDQTLWNGVCGEDEVNGIKIDPPFRALQEFMIAQQQAGKLICLCSKNQPEDVFRVFEQHPDMLLKRDHLVNWRINWQAKSENLKSLATELQLGLDSFIFIDDNPIECAEVRANSPDVLTLQLPQDCHKITQFLEHIWAFEQLQTTEEDKQRTTLYQQNKQRQHLQENSLSFQDFLAQLNLEVEILPLEKEQLPRVAQLTQRTNQFNLTTIRRSETEIQKLCNLDKFEGQIVKVKDRFGDYGLVGLLLFEYQENALMVDTFLLSCRVLGRGVEHKMLAHLGNLAQEKGLKKISLVYKPTEKNQPILNFLISCDQEFRREKTGDCWFEFPSETASRVQFLPTSHLDNLETNNNKIQSNIKIKDNTVEKTSKNYSSEFFENIAQTLYSPEQILKEITSRQQKQRPELEIEFIAPRTALEKAIASLFVEVLQLEEVGINDDFFELGGDSIRGAILINKLQAKLNEIIHFVVLFDTKTVKKLAKYLEKNYSKAVTKLLKQKLTEVNEKQDRIDGAKVLQMRSLIPAFASTVDDDTIKNPPTIFILSPHRSGSTLLRVMLGGNPKLFAPPELELLGFETLGARKARFSGRDSFWREGTIRAIMEIRGYNTEEAIALMEELEADNLTIKQFYGLIQQWLGEKILVDKTPSYSIDLETLKQAERYFQNPLYIHLLRHPLGTIHSYEAARVEQTFPYEHPFNRRELAELVWLISQQNILEFLQKVPQNRQYQVKFEDLVSQTQNTVEGICQFLGLDFHPDMLQPYKDTKQRMTDGIYAQSRMIGDVKFHQHQGINQKTIDSWKDDYTTDFLGDGTWQLAETLGYSRNSLAIPKISRKTGTDSQIFPLSFAQQRLWILAQLEPDSPFYNMFKAVRLQGPINLDILEQSINEIIRRHEILRTNFREEDGIPVQIIATQATLKLSVLDLQALSAQQQSEQLQFLATQEQLQPFDLTTGLLLRVTVVQLNSESYALLLTMHHIIGDGWSMGVFFKELSSLYQCFLVGNPSTLPALPIQYADFTIWQRQWLQGAVPNQINYWKKQLGDAPPLLELPTDRPRPSVQTYRGSCFSFELDVKLTQKIKQLSHQSGTTLFMTLIAAYTTLLLRYSNQEDILVGTAIANRNHEDIEGLIGFFVNTLVVRSSLEGNPKFSEFLKQVTSTCKEAYANQDVPFEAIIDALQIERSLSHSPLFQVMFVLQNAPSEQVETPNLAIAPLSLNEVNAKFDLALQMWESKTESGDSLQGSWQYNSDLFEPSTIARMSQHFQTLLEAIVINPEQTINLLPLLTQQERYQLLEAWNDTQVDYLQDKCLHQLFEEQVKCTPDAVAVVFENQQLTYQELNSRANQLAHYLQSLGLKTDQFVGILLERSLDMIVGILGILKAGGAYVPLDVNYPQERLTYIFEDTKLDILLTKQQHLETLLAYQGTTICLDGDWPIIATEKTVNPITGVASDNLAYIIYTSGSTGKPKGVMIEHRSVVNYIQTIIQQCSLTSDDNQLQFFSICFDASVDEIFGCLSSGATLVLRTEEMLRSSEYFWHCCQAWQLTILGLSTAYWHQLVSDLTSDALQVIENIKLIIVGGEALQLSKVKQWHQITSNCSSLPKLFNGYGPTETTILSTLYEFTSVDINNVTIGRPINNAQIYILDSHLQPVPIGVPGELNIGGAGLARGYLNRPELTNEKFITNPFEEGSKLYKTGDLARYLPDGNIEYLGRIDHQVKVRGFRIELGEIETVLSQSPQIQQSVVIVREETAGDKRLVAYLVPQPEISIKIEEIRQFLKAKLPDYMVPNGFVILETLPLTPNGKIDRRALPAPEFDSRDKYVAPRTPIEEILANICSQILKVDQVGINDNFFELGGHSLLATQLISRIRQNLQTELPLRSLFATPTLAELAQQIQTLQQQELATVAPILPRDTAAKLVLSYAQQRLWFLDQFEPNSALYNIPIALRLEGNLNQTALEQSLEKIIQRHEVLHTNFITVEGEPVQIIHPQIDWSISVVNLEHLSTTEQEINYQQFINNQAIQPFNLATEPLIRATLVTLNETEHLLMICMHHVISDGWSMGVFVEELAKLYDAYTQENSSPLDPLTLQYADFALWQRNWLQGEVQEKQLAYWQQQLENAATFLPLPTDQPRPAAQTFVGSHQQFSLTPELSQKLVKLSQAQGVTLFMTLFAAFNVLLYRYSGQADILVGTPIANRNHREIEGLIGFFVNTLVLRTDLSENPSFEQLLTQVREVALGAYAHQDLPFEMLVEALQPERDISHPPLFQVMFALQNASLSTLELSGLSVSRLPLETGIAKFDLTLSMEQTCTGLTGVWEYNTDLFDSNTIGRMSGHFVTLLEGIVTNLDTPITQLPLLTAWEEKQLLVDWNNTQTDYPQDKCIHQLFEEQVKR
nr:amino acid adenylation domain-containing protein [Crocosphaera sp.]